MLRVKPGVVLDGLLAPAARAIAEAVEAFGAVDADAVVTSALDGQHMLQSLHYRGLAVDFRTKHTTRMPEVVKALKATLGSDYDVLWEQRGQANEHLHVEYDPKG